ncbi:EamA family transporter, partial [Clostridium perfringens]
ESLNAKVAVGIGSTVGGTLLIQGAPGEGNPLAASHLAGNLLVLGAAASESLFNIFSRAASREGKQPKAAVDPIAQTTLVTAAAFMFSLVPALGERPFAAVSPLDLTGWLALVLYGWVVTALAFICWYAGIRRSSAFTAAAYS